MADNVSDIWFAVGVFLGGAWDSLVLLELKLTDQQPKAKEALKQVKISVNTFRNRAVTLTDPSHDWSQGAVETAIELTKSVMNWQLVIQRAVDLSTDLVSVEQLQLNLAHFGLNTRF